MKTRQHEAGASSPPPLAEARWFYRRMFTFAISAGLWLLLMRAVDRTAPADLPATADGLMGLLALILVLYLVAPTAEQLVALIANARIGLAGGRA